MNMRGTKRRGVADAVLPSSFGWDRMTAVSLDHASLPWQESIVWRPLADSLRGGARDRLSLVAQFAAHQAFLSFAGITDADPDIAEWGVVQKRGEDVRLIRIAARHADSTAAPPALSVIQHFAAALEIELTIFRQPWARADAVYAEAFLRLCRDVAADLRWARRSATGSVLSPGPEGLRMLLHEEGQFQQSDPRSVEVIERYAAGDPSIALMVLRGTSPLQRYSALPAELADPRLAPAEVSDRLLSATADARHLFVVANENAFDEGSRAVVRLLSALRHGAWLLPDEGEPLPPTRTFIVAPRLAGAPRLGREIGSLSEFAQSPAFEGYLRDGEIPEVAAPFPELAEPARSYVGALALLGHRIPNETARSFLAEFLFHGELRELVVPGVSIIEEDEYRFVDSAARARAASLIPPASRPAISRAAATFATGVDAALLWIEAGDHARATATLERSSWPDADVIVAELSRVPPAALSDVLRQRLAHALIDCGRYQDAAQLAPDDEFVLARAERRTGDYAAALARLERMTASFDVDLLRAEVLRLLAKPSDARTILERCRPSSAVEVERLDYERGLLGDDVALPESSYRAIRLATYRALGESAFDEAVSLAMQSRALARTTGDRIDSLMDLMFASFAAGRWSESRVHALEALREVEETQGDRAAGGILFLLSFLAADDGQWAHAAQRLSRLRHYYGATQDEIRLAELQLLSAHLDFSRGRFDDAARAASAVVSNGELHPQIVEAAALILDEIAWLERRGDPLLSTGGAGNEELRRRHLRIVRCRSGQREPLDPTGAISERLFAFRQAIATGDDRTARALASELDLVYEPGGAGEESEQTVLRLAATRPFPFAKQEFGREWCFATRNRLGQWNSIGSFSPSNEQLEQSRGSAGWIACGERELLFLEGSSSWSEAGREAVAATFRIRAENQRLRRLIEQEDATRPNDSSLEGVLGQSSAIREVETLVLRVARREVPVCVLGESGTGKELVARAIHRNSPRRQKPFTPVNCAALPENLVESELFGHVRGAFTGADRDRAGLIETTDGGTLFLDEIGELPLLTQAKLLRFLQEGEFRRVGDTSNRTADVRVVSATNRKLDEAVEEGSFREDLYYRIRGVEVALPPLRDRGADILLLAAHFLSTERAAARGGPVAFSADTEAIFTAYRWPGNVRELQNTVRAAHAMAGESREIQVAHLPERLRNVAPSRAPAGSYQDAVTRFKRELIERSLLEARGNQNKAAAMLRISRQALAYQIRELGIMIRS